MLKVCRVGALKSQIPELFSGSRVSFCILLSIRDLKRLIAESKGVEHQIRWEIVTIWVLKVCRCGALKSQMLVLRSESRASCCILLSI